MSFATPTVITTFSPGQNGGNSAATFNTTGYDLIVIFTSTFSTEASPPAVTDNHGNTYTQGDSVSSPGGSIATMYYKYNPNVGTGTQFTVIRNDSFPSVIVIGCTGALILSTPYDQHNSNSTSSESSVQPGSVTPSFNNEIIFCGLSSGASANSDMTISGDSFTKLSGVDWIAGTNIASAVGYVIQTTASAANPTWSSANSTIGLASVIASFQSILTQIKTINGVAKANVKTVNGVAIANVKNWNGLT